MLCFQHPGGESEGAEAGGGCVGAKMLLGDLRVPVLPVLLVQVSGGVLVAEQTEVPWLLTGAGVDDAKKWGDGSGAGVATVATHSLSRLVSVAYRFALGAQGTL
jgi:hypothetical protein